MKNKLSSLLLVLSLVFTMAMPEWVQATQSSSIKNIIFMIPDGGGMESFYLADALKQNGGWDRRIYPNSTVTNAEEMYAKQYLVGAVTTHSASSGVTDSAAAGTALSSGYKTTNQFVGVDTYQAPHANILEAAQYVGKNTGMVTTYSWVNATPATFSAHYPGRGKVEFMSEQIVNQDIDVVLGTGFLGAQWGDISEVEIRGYDVINTREDLQAVQPGDKIWGNLVPGGFPYDIEATADIPNLAEMTKAAITALDDGNENGFFLMVEGSQVDGGGHANYVQGMVGEFLAFDEACKVALQYAENRKDTIVVIVPDHDTGGMILPEDLSSAIEFLRLGIDPNDITWETTGHTDRNGGLFMYVPEGAEYPQGISGESMGTQQAYLSNVIDNTAIAPYLADYMGVNLDEMTKKLFVDVTDIGVYDSGIKAFRFIDYPVIIRPNVSHAFVRDEVVDLDGQVSLHINGRFYVPQLLLDIAEGKANGKVFEHFDSSFSSGMETYAPDLSNVYKQNGKINFTNYIPQKDISGGKIKFTSPASFAHMEEIVVGTIKGGSTTTVEFECPQFDVYQNNMKFEYTFTSNEGKVYSFSSTFRGLAFANYADDPIKIDGIIDESVWEDSLVMTLNDESRLVDKEEWKGDRDLSAELALAWDEDFLYMYAIVSDEIFHQTYSASNLWQGDSIQAGFFYDEGNQILNGNAGKEFEEIGLAMINGNPVAYRFGTQGKTNIGTISQSDNFEFQCKQDGIKLTYEMKFRWSALFGREITPKMGDSIGFSALVNDNDGSSRGYMEYGSGIGQTKDVNQFISMALIESAHMPAVESNHGIKLFYNGQELNPDVEPIIVNNRTLVPVRVIFEALGATVEWNQNTRAVISKLGDTEVKLQIDSAEISINGEKRAIDVPAQIVNNRTLVPVRAVSEAYGCNIEWDASDRSVIISK